jgi:hypothetical protein
MLGADLVAFSVRRWGVLLALGLSGSALVPACGNSAQPRARMGTPAGGGEGGESGTPSQAAGGRAADGGAALAGEAMGGVSPAQSGAPPADPSAGAGGAEPPEPEPEPDLVIRRISIAQSLELPLMRDGQAVPADMRPAPLVAGKRALVRAFVQLTPEFAARDLIGLLDLKSPSGDDTLIAERYVSAGSAQDNLASTFVFDVLARDLAPTTTYRLRVLEADTAPLARFPESGYAPLEARRLPPFKLVVVPMVANGFSPKIGAPEVESLRSRMLALMPASAVDIDVVEPVTLDYTLNASGSGWNTALRDIYDIREAAQPAHDVFYYGMLAPAATFDDYCQDSCYLGYARLTDPEDVDFRGAIGVALFADGSGTEDAWDTVVHELGHSLGREHSPCGVDEDDQDPSFPYPAGDLGSTYGYDFGLSALVKPKEVLDVMGYCVPVWISDYTYRGMFERLEYIAGEQFRALSAAAPAAPQVFRVAELDLFGRASWASQRMRSLSPERLRAVALLDAAGSRMGTVAARVVRYDHGGGELWLPAEQLAASGAAAVDLSMIGGGALAL